MSTPKANAE